MKRIGLAIASVALATSGLAALAGGPGAVRKQVEASMLITGTIRIDSAGKVTGYTFDDKEKLPSGVVAMLDRRVPGWTFEPVMVEGKAANVSTYMNIRLVAKKLDKDNYSVEIRSASFGQVDKSSRAKRVQDAVKADLARAATEPRVCKKEDLAPPPYPDAGARSRVQANVYLLVKAGADGQVQEVIAEQVNMKVVADERSMERWRRLFADAAVKQARKWCIEPPDDDTDARYGFHLARVPVVFHMAELTPYGQWEAYVPGPRAANPWQADSEGKGFSPDTLVPGRAYIAGTGLKLLTELSDS